MNLGLDQETLQYLASLLGRHEGDMVAAGKALHNLRRSSGIGQRGKALQKALRQLEEAEEQANRDRARQLRQHLESRGVVTTDNDLDSLADPYSNAGIGTSGYTRRQGRP